MNASSNLDKLKTIELNKYEAILIDIDDTLYDYKKSHKIAIDLVYNQHSVLLNNIGFKQKDEFILNYDMARVKVKQLHPNNALTRSRYLAFLELFISTKTNLPTYYYANILEEDYWTHFVNNMPSRPSDEWMLFLDKCLSLKIKICAVTDMQTRYQVHKLRKLNLTKYIQHMITSEDINVEKPDNRVFKAALKILNSDPKKTLVLGDNHEKDILGGIAIGCDAIRLGYNLS